MSDRPTNISRVEPRDTYLLTFFISPQGILTLSDPKSGSIASLVDLERVVAVTTADEAPEKVSVGSSSYTPENFSPGYKILGFVLNSATIISCRGPSAFIDEIVGKVNDAMNDIKIKKKRSNVGDVAGTSS